MKIVFKALNKTVTYMRQNRLTSRIFFMLDDLGLTVIISKLFYWLKNLINYYYPTEEMLYSNHYFSSHQQEINKIYSILSNDISKSTYLNMIKFRSTYNNNFLPCYSYKRQYFGNDFFIYNENEVFLDCGSWDGDTIRIFKKLMKKQGIKSWKCIAFEPDPVNYLSLKRNHPNVLAIKSGLGNKTQQQRFLMNNNGSSCLVNEDGNNKQFDKNFTYIDVKKLDDIEECKNATFIKMDIEGGEYEALLGAKKIIKTNKPKLAICIYHKDEDFIRIPLMVHELVPEYRLYILHHSNTIYETVLYATI